MISKPAENTAAIASMRLLLDSLREPAFFIEPGGEVRYANAATLSLRPAPAGSGHPLLDHLHSLSGEPAPLLSAPFFLTAIAGEVCTGVEMLYMEAGQVPARVVITSAPVLDGGKVAGVAVTVHMPALSLSAHHDETAPREHALQALNDLAARLLSLNSTAEVYHAALDGFLEVMGADRGALVLNDDTARCFRTIAHRFFSEATLRRTAMMPYDEAPALSRVRETGEIVTIHSDDASPLGRNVLGSEGMNTAVMLPLLRRGERIGVLSYWLEERREVTAFENEILRTASTYVSAALERIQLFEEADAERKRLARILEQLPVGVFIAEGDPEQRTFRWSLINRAGQEQFRAPSVAPGVVSETFTVLHPDGRPYTDEELPLQATIWTGEPAPEQELRFRYHSGEERIFLSNINILQESEGLRMAIAVSQDVTERKRLEERVLKHAEQITAEYERLAAIVGSVDVALTMLDASGRISLVNEAWEGLTGYKREQVIGAKFSELGTWEAELDRQGLVESVLKTGVPAQIREYYHRDSRHSDGLYIDGSLMPVRDAEGSLIGVLWAALDVTQKVRAKEEIEGQRAILQTIVEATPVGLVFFDNEMRIVNMNAHWARMLHLDAADVQGKSLYEIVPSAEARREIHARVLGGEAVDHENVAFTPPGEERTVRFDIHYRPVRGAGGEVTGILGAIIDMTDRYEAAQQKDQFIALASHELKTPVTAIKGYAQMGLRSVRALGDERLTRTLGIIDEKADHLTRLINDLLDVSRVDSSSLALYREVFDMGDLAREVISGFELTAPEFEFLLTLDGAPMPVDGDRQRIEQVIVNLIQNAIKYSGGSRRVELTVRPEGDEIVTEVRDFGVGIPESQQAQVFQRFFRASNVSNWHYSGLGLGLFIAQGIITRHGGRMWLTSKEKEGSTFAFSLPRVGEQE